MRTRVGYAGGTSADPTYHDLGDHTEALQVDYDPARISYEQLLEVFWGSHDPCRQAWSTQYKAVLFYHDEEQQRLALDARDTLAATGGAAERRITTEIVPAGRFYRAEDYHQKYYLRRNRGLATSVRALFESERAFIDSTAAARANAFLGRHLPRAALGEELRALGLEARGDGEVEAIHALPAGTAADASR